MNKYQKLSAFVAVALVAGQAAVALGQLAPAPSVDTSVSTPTSTAPAASTSTVETVIAPDTTAPHIIAIAAVSVEPTTMVVTWTTDELAYGRVEYGLSAAYGSSTPESAVASLEQTQTITGLAVGTVYHYRIAATDAAGNVTYSESRTITTAAEPEIVDNAPPGVLNVAVSNVTTSSAAVQVTTDELARVQIEYGTSEQYGSSVSAGDEFALDHALSITGLAASTTYHYRVFAEDVAGNQAYAFDNTFTTAPPAAVPVIPPPPVVAPEIPVATSTETIATTTVALLITEPLTSSIGTSTAEISWITNKVSDGTVAYTGPHASGTAQTATSGTVHTVLLTGLSPETNYSYVITAHDAATGETVTVENLEFNTLPVLTHPASILISSVETEVGTSTAAILWDTNLLGTGEVHYGTSTAYGSSSGYAGDLKTSHVHTLTGLAHDTKYNFQVLSEDAAGNMTISENYVFRTASSTVTNVISEATTTLNETETILEEEAGLENKIVDENTGIAVIPTLPEDLPLPPPPVLQGGAAPPTPLLPATLTHAEALDGQALLIFEEPPGHHTTNVRVVRNAHTVPKHPKDGVIVYQGNSASFTDVNLANGHTYHYAIYGVDVFRGFSPPVLLAVTPIAGKTQSILEATPETTPITPKFAFSQDMAAGDMGRDVRHAQLLLAQNSQIYPQGLITGYFGPLTAQAITQFQAKHSLLATGFADAATRAKLESISEIRTITKQSSFYRNLSSGMQGHDVLALQTFLSAEGQYPQALFTGYFGPLTKAALIRFQSVQGIIPASGYFGPATRQKVEEITTRKK